DAFPPAVDNARFGSIFSSEQGSMVMARLRGWTHSIVIVSVVLVLPHLAAAQMRKGSKDSSEPKSYLPPDNYTPTQLRAHIDKLHKTSVKDRKPEVAEGIVMA